MGINHATSARLRNYPATFFTQDGAWVRRLRRHAMDDRVEKRVKM